MADSEDASGGSSSTATAAIPVAGRGAEAEAALSTSDAAPSTATLSPLELYTEAFDEMRQLVHCKVCVRPMYEPYTVACGHTFCYSCLKQWFEHHARNKTCPECRAKVWKRPAPSYAMREIVQLFLKRPALMPNDEFGAEHEEARKEEAQQVEKDRTAGQLFGQNFHDHRDRQGFFDAEDRVMRCPECHWELEDGYCPHCHIDFDLDHSFSDHEYSTDNSVRSSDRTHPRRPPPQVAAELARFFSDRLAGPAVDDDLHSVESYDFDSEDEDLDDTDLEGFIDDDLHSADGISEMTDASHATGPTRRHSFSPGSSSHSDLAPDGTPRRLYDIVWDPSSPGRTPARRRGAPRIDDSSDESSSASRPPSRDRTASISRFDPTSSTRTASISQSGHTSPVDRDSDIESSNDASDDTAGPATTLASRPARKRRRVVDDEDDDEDNESQSGEGDHLISSHPSARTSMQLHRSQASSSSSREHHHRPGCPYHRNSRGRNGGRTDPAGDGPAASSEPSTLPTATPRETRNQPPNSLNRFPRSRRGRIREGYA